MHFLQQFNPKKRKKGSYNTTSLINHLKSKHQEEYEEFKKNKADESQKQPSSNKRASTDDNAKIDHFFLTNPKKSQFLS